MILRIKAYQEFACYRKPISYGFWESYPLPTISNIRGWFHRVIEAKEYVPLSVGVTGCYKSVVYDLQTLIKFARVRNKKEDSKRWDYLENFNCIMSRSPKYVANLYGVELIIYIKSSEDALNRFKENVLLYEYPSIGRREDLVRIDSIDFFCPEEVDFSKQPQRISYGIYLNKETSNRLNLEGINYRMNFKYDKNLLDKTGLRYFQKKDVVYVDSGIVKTGSSLFDRNYVRIVDLIGDL
ncbi:MAG: type I-B CRISPR-associated protein Cas5b [Caldimicrobium sp.]|nr:type I-B CRISPR-associated protein Cas5b [Caldimicrobium sp.]